MVTALSAPVGPPDGETPDQREQRLKERFNTLVAVVGAEDAALRVQIQRDHEMAVSAEREWNADYRASLPVPKPVAKNVRTAKGNKRKHAARIEGRTTTRAPGDKKRVPVADQVSVAVRQRVIRQTGRRLGFNAPAWGPTGAYTRIGSANQQKG